MAHVSSLKYGVWNVYIRQGLHAMHSTAQLNGGHKHELTHSANAWGQRTWCNGYIGGFDEKWQN